jgi:hypothetical protein
MKELLLFIVCFHPAALLFAQTEEQSLRDERKQLTLVTEPVTLYKGFFRVGLGTAYSLADKRFIDSKKEPLSGQGWANTFTVSLSAQYGISDRLMVGVTVPYTNDNIYHSTLYEVPSDEGRRYLYPQRWLTQAKGVGDVEVVVASQLLAETNSRPALAVVVITTLPTGEKNIVDDGDENANTFARPTGQGEVAISTALRLRKITYPFVYSGAFSYKYRTESSKVVAVNEPTVRCRNADLLRFSGSFYFHLNDWIAFRNDSDYVRFGQDMQDGEKVTEKGWLWQYSPGISFQLSRLRIDQAVDIPLKGNHVAADPKYFLALQYIF